MPGQTVPRLLLIGAAVGALLGGCKPNPQQVAAVAPPPLAALPLSSAAPSPAAVAPAARDLAPAPPARWGGLANRADLYAFADRGYALNAAFADAPPDYAFDYGDGEAPWVWQGDDQYVLIAEPLQSGWFRYYYYQPGADLPYLVRDPSYSYGFDRGVLVALYDHEGRALPARNLGRHADMAGRFLARGRSIRDAARRGPHRAVAQADWAARRKEIGAEQSQWAADAAANENWRAYHATHAQAYRAQWSAERYRREAEAARFAQATHDPQAAARDLQAARQAQARAEAASRIATARADARSLLDLGPGPSPSGAPQASPPPAEMR